DLSHFFSRVYGRKCGADAATAMGLGTCPYRGASAGLLPLLDLRELSTGTFASAGAAQSGVLSVYDSQRGSREAALGVGEPLVTDFRGSDPIAQYQWHIPPGQMLISGHAAQTLEAYVRPFTDSCGCSLRPCRRCAEKARDQS